MIHLEVKNAVGVSDLGRDEYGGSTVGAELLCSWGRHHVMTFRSNGKKQGPRQVDAGDGPEGIAHRELLMLGRAWPVYRKHMRSRRQNRRAEPWGYDTNWALL